MHLNPASSGCTILELLSVERVLIRSVFSGAGKELYQSGALGMGQRASTGLTTL